MFILHNQGENCYNSECYVNEMNWFADANKKRRWTNINRVNLKQSQICKMPAPNTQSKAFFLCVFD